MERKIWRDKNCQCETVCNTLASGSTPFSNAFSHHRRPPGIKTGIQTSMSPTASHQRSRERVWAFLQGFSTLHGKHQSTVLLCPCLFGWRKELQRWEAQNDPEDHPHWDSPQTSQNGYPPMAVHPAWGTVRSITKVSRPSLSAKDAIFKSIPVHTTGKSPRPFVLNWPIQNKCLSCRRYCWMGSFVSADNLKAGFYFFIPKPYNSREALQTRDTYPLVPQQSSRTPVANTPQIDDWTPLIPQTVNNIFHAINLMNWTENKIIF